MGRASFLEIPQDAARVVLFDVRILFNVDAQRPNDHDRVVLCPIFVFALLDALRYFAGATGPAHRLPILRDDSLLFRRISIKYV